MKTYIQYAVANGVTLERVKAFISLMATAAKRDVAKEVEKATRLYHTQLTSHRR